MSVYNDMAHDGGEAYGTEGNQQLAEMIEADHMREMEEAEEERMFDEAMEDAMLQDARDAAREESDAHGIAPASHPQGREPHAEHSED